MSEATEPSALAAIGDWPEHARPQPGRGPDRRQKHRCVPITAGWLALLIGLADVVSAVIPRLQLVHRLHRITPFVPGVLTNVTFTADVLIGLLLLMLSHGLRRRKRRAWQASCLLLSFSVLIHLVHAPYLAPGVVSAILLAGRPMRSSGWSAGPAPGVAAPPNAGSPWPWAASAGPATGIA
jgi:hypothetical protein